MREMLIVFTAFYTALLLPSLAAGYTDTYFSLLADGLKSSGPVCYPSSSHCSANADCQTIGGKQYCVCNDGYQGDGSTCSQVDYCKMGVESCPGNSNCFNNASVTYCECKPGFSLGGVNKNRCQVDSCWSNPCGEPSIALCYAYPLGYDCGCVDGYAWTDNKCVDVDECAESTDACSQYATCTNTPGSYNCTCDEGYLDIDGKGRKCVYDVILYSDAEQQCLQQLDDAIVSVNVSDNAILFGSKLYSVIHISTNGYVTFGSSYNAYYPKTNPSAPLLALYWADMDNSRSDSSICYTLHSDTSDEIFEQLGVKLAKYGVSLDAKFVVQVTYTDVHPYPAERYANETVTAQLVVATDNVRTYALFNYAYNQVNWNSYATWRPLLVGSTQVLNESNWIHQVPPSTTFALDQLVGNTEQYGSWYRLIGALGSKRDDESLAVSLFEELYATEYSGSGESSGIVDQCSQDPQPCYPGTECSVLDDEVQCGSCPSGMENYEGNKRKCAFTTPCSANPCKAYACIQTSASTYTCQCPPGYNYSTTNPNVCVDINECRTYPCRPDQVCQNTPGSYICSCGGAGFTQHPNGTCIDVDECLSDVCLTAISNDICENTYGSYKCSCKPGFVRTHSACEDINECESGVANCQYGCVNLIGSYMCTCPFANTLYNSTSCIQIDYCKQNVCPPSYGCQTLPDSSYECQLLPTFSAQLTTTNAILPTTTAHIPTTTAQLPTTATTAGSASTSAFITTTPDYCLTGLNNCSENANCLTVTGGWKCVCKEGFIGDGYYCYSVTTTNRIVTEVSQATVTAGGTTVRQTTTQQPTVASTAPQFSTVVTQTTVHSTTVAITATSTASVPVTTTNNYCASGLNNCSVDATCENTADAWKCTCKPGFTGNGYTCTQVTTLAATTQQPTSTAVDKCLENQIKCHANATCKLSPSTNTWLCVCKEGFLGDGLYCIEADYCGNGWHNCSIYANCQNVPGGWTCQCKPGYTGNGYSCKWKNPCDPNPCGPGNCYPLQDGSHTCFCNSGYTLNSTTNKCEDEDECATQVSPCPAGTECKNTIGSFTCESTVWIDSNTVCTSNPDSVKSISLGCFSIPYGNKARNTLYLTKYGYVTFDVSYVMANPTNKPPSDVPLFAIWWSNLRWFQGKLCYSIHTGSSNSDSVIMGEVSKRISTYHKTNFTANIVIIVNYENVSSNCGNGHEKETIFAQGVVASDGVRTYLLYNYPMGKMKWNGHSSILVGSSMTITAGSPLNNMNWISQVPRKQPQDALLETYDLDKIVGNTGLVGSWWQQVGSVNANHYAICCRWLQTAVILPVYNTCPSTYDQVIRDSNFVYLSSKLMSNTGSKQVYRYCYADRFYFLIYLYNQSTNLVEGIYFKQQCCFSYEVVNGRGYGGALYRSMPDAGTVFTSNTPEYEAYIREQCILAKLESRYIVYRPISYDWSYRPPNNGNGNGDPHFTTLDGAEYTFNGLGQYVLTRTNNLYAGASPFSVHTHTELVTGNGGATVFKDFTVIASVNGSNSSSVYFYYKNDLVQVRVDGVEQSIGADETKVFYDLLAIWRPSESGNLTVTYRHGLQVTVQAGFGSSLQIQLGLPQQYSNALEGLLGDLDGDKTNDFKCKNGTILSADSTQRSLYDFGESWAVEMSTSRNHKNYAPVFVDELDDAKLLTELFNNNVELFSASNEVCSATLAIDKLRYNACMLDSAGLESANAGSAVAQTYQNFDRFVKIMRNLAPVFNMPAEVNLKKGETLQLFIDVYDPDNTTVEIAIEWVDPNSTNQLPQFDSDKRILSWTPDEAPESLTAWQIVATDADGASTFWSPDLLYCACQNGNCSFEQYFNQSSELMSTSSNVYVGVCTCWGAYGGTYCERSPCGSDQESNPCYDNAACTIVEYNFVCAPCPDGLEGDGVACYNRFTACYENVSGEAVSRCGEFECREYSNNSYSCECPSGYLPHPKLICAMADNCSIFACKNNMICGNDDKCTCPDGFVEVPKNMSCTGANLGACKLGDVCKSDETNTECTELDATGATYNCACKLGFQEVQAFNATHRQCEQKLACPPTGTVDCVTCIETGNSSYICTCQDGYSFNATSKKCQLIDYCSSVPCAAGLACVNILGGYVCESVAVDDASVDVGLIVGICVAALAVVSAVSVGIYFFIKKQNSKAKVDIVEAKNETNGEPTTSTNVDVFVAGEDEVTTTNVEVFEVDQD